MAHTLTAGQVEYRHYLKSPRWRLLRFLRHILDGGACQDCLRHGRITRRRLETHHTTYAHRGGAFLAELGDLVTLCADCHAARHGRGRDD